VAAGPGHRAVLALGLKPLMLGASTRSAAARSGQSRRHPIWCACNSSPRRLRHSCWTQATATPCAMRRCRGAPQWPAAADRHPQRTRAEFPNSSTSGPPGGTAPAFSLAAQSVCSDPWWQPWRPARRTALLTVDLDLVRPFPFCRGHRPPPEPGGFLWGHVQGWWTNSATTAWWARMWCGAFSPLLDPAGKQRRFCEWQSGSQPAALARRPAQ